MAEPQSAAISLPKGGGAIKNLGETFSPNIFTGAGTYSVPIATSPSRNGFGPKLSLSYSTGSGNGPFGLGWTLGMQRISCKTESGLPTYTDKDVFVLAGSEDLVPVVDPSTGAPIEKTLQAFTTYADATPTGYRVTRFRPRVEGLFARTERWERISDRDVHWRVTTDDNTTSIYGRTQEARVFDPAPGRSHHVFEWLLQETFNDRGEHILYEYIREASGLAHLGIAERNRSHAQVYPRRILYGPTSDSLPVPRRKGPVRTGSHQRNTAQTLTRHYVFEVLFDYYDLPDEPQIPFDWSSSAELETGADWPVREDPFSVYRSGFELRTLRLCRRVLMLHHFDEDAVRGAPLIRATEFRYQQEAHTRFTQLEAVSSRGYKAKGGAYLSLATPPVAFEYSAFEPSKQRYQSVTAAVNDLPPHALSDADTALVDIYGDGLPDILMTTAGGQYYWRNEGGAMVSRLQPPGPVPATVRLSDGNVAVGDMGGDGLPDLIVQGAGSPGFFEALPDGGWSGFRPFRTIPSFDLADPDLRLVDLTGDGRSDILITAPDRFLWYRCLGEQGYEGPYAVERIHDLERFPDVSFGGNADRVRLADMTGDGLADIVYVHSGRIEYWPSLGYGRFGPRVVMANAPLFDATFDPRRVFLVDLDGSGCTDLVYVDLCSVHFWFNLSGNGFGARCSVHGTPIALDPATVRIADFFGTGTAALVWGYENNAAPEANYKVLDLAGAKKPHLLNRVVNNLGGETRIQYGSSTKFYLEDRKAGRPWCTHLPFPVQVVERVESIDWISRTRAASRFAYHHGYFDGTEREFRGFGMVEQWDTETFVEHSAAVAAIGGHQSIKAEDFQPPVLTRTWFHTGAIPHPDGLSSLFRQEYYQETRHLPDSDLSPNVSAAEYREAVRALKGLTLRSEVYGLDGTVLSAHPYGIAESRYEVRLVQPKGTQSHAVFFPVGREGISLQYDRQPDDPRIGHQFMLEVDTLGNVLRSCSVTYGRRKTDPALPAAVAVQQQRLRITYGEADYTNDIDRDAAPIAYRLRTVCESRSYEITGIAPGGTLFTLPEIRSKIVNTVPLRFESSPDHVTPQRRLLSQTRTLFLDDTLAPLALGQRDTLGLGFRRYQLAFTPSLVATYLGSAVSDAEFLAAGYTHFDGDANWWIPGGTATYAVDAAQHFYLPVVTRNPMGLGTRADRDPYDLLVERVASLEAAWQVVTARNDYRTLGPVMMTDPNGNRSAVEIDALGMVVASAVLGKVGAGEGDTLADPTVRLEYDLFNWLNNRQPNVVRSYLRETHGTATSRWQVSFAYTNGSGGVALVKGQAPPGKAWRVAADGTAEEVDVDPRWVGDGRAILNNKGRPVLQYEPYFSTTQDFEDEAALRQIGVSPLVRYDALGRETRRLYPNGTMSQSEYGPWRHRVFDANDTALASSWYIDRGSPDPAVEAEPLNDPERRAAWLTATHADTPGSAYFDTLGSVVYSVNSFGAGATATTRVERDLGGPYTRVFDQLGRLVSETVTAMAGTVMLANTAERGRQWSFANVLGDHIKTWDENGRRLRTVYDNLNRPVTVFARGPGAPERAIGHTVYGDRHPNAAQHNLLGATHMRFDTAGLVRVPSLDFKGNPTSAERILAADPIAELDWSAVAAVTTYSNVQSSADILLDTTEVFVVRAEIDALNRPTRMVLPDDTIIKPSYNIAGSIASLQARIRGQGAFVEFLKEQEYDAKGQRQYARFGNDVIRRYVYDPKSFRLTNLLSVVDGSPPSSAALQDLHYTYDPVGNIVEIWDDAQQRHFFNNAVVRARSRFVYDAGYRLARATGREHAGLVNNRILGSVDLVAQALPAPNVAGAVREFSETYAYDLLGNIKTLRHRYKTQAGAGSGWTRRYRYVYESAPSDQSNRLSSTSQPGDAALGPYSGTFDHDLYGNITRMPHLPVLSWNVMDQLREVDRGGGGRAHYVYGGGGQRMRKVLDKGGRSREEWIYLGAVMLYRRRRRATGAIELERSTVNIADNAGPIAQVITKTVDTANLDSANPIGVPLFRYLLTNHLGSSTLETDEAGNVISYEEFHPFGTSAYRAHKPGGDVSLKRFRYSGKERDDETGLYYFGARYLAPWLGRWISADPSGLQSGLNLYRYCHNNPVALHDPNGMQDVLTAEANQATIERLNSPKADPREVLRYFQQHGHPELTNDQTPTWNKEQGMWQLSEPARPKAHAQNQTKAATTAVQEAVRPRASAAPDQQARARVGEPRTFAPGEPLAGPYNLWSNERGGGLKDAARAPGYIMEDTSFEDAAEAAAKRLGYSGRYDPTLTGPDHGAVWNPPSDDLATRAGITQTTVTSQGLEPARSPPHPNPAGTVQAAREIPRVFLAGGLIAQLGKLSGVATALFALQSDNRLVRGIGIASGALEYAAGNAYLLGVASIGSSINPATVASLQTFGRIGGRIGGGVGMITLSGYAFYEHYQVKDYGVMLGDSAGVVGGVAALAGSGPVGGVAVGVAVTNTIGDWVESAVTPGQGRTAGVAAGTATAAMAGAAIGAAVGVWFFGVGAGVGAAAGFLIGGVAGFIGAYW